MCEFSESVESATSAVNSLMAQAALLNINSLGMPSEKTPSTRQPNGFICFNLYRRVVLSLFLVDSNQIVSCRLKHRTFLAEVLFDFVVSLKCRSFRLHPDDSERLEIA